MHSAQAGVHAMGAALAGQLHGTLELGSPQLWAGCPGWWRSGSLHSFASKYWLLGGYMTHLETTTGKLRASSCGIVRGRPTSGSRSAFNSRSFSATLRSRSLGTFDAKARPNTAARSRARCRTTDKSRPAHQQSNEQCSGHSHTPAIRDYA